MKKNSVYILGRQPAIGRAELESLFGSEHLRVLNPQVVLVDQTVTPQSFTRLGSSIKAGLVLATLPRNSLTHMSHHLSNLVLESLRGVSEGKIQIGLSAYGLRTTSAQLMAVGLGIKKALRAQHYSVRLTPNKDLALSSAQVLHNHLTGEHGIELLLVQSRDEIIIARTVATQDITDYTNRDRGRPKRDAFVGMLPPKLAQTIINMAAGRLSPQPTTIVLDPFCGTGVVLQEALLMGYGTYGTDVEPRMIDYSAANLVWLQQRYGVGPAIAVEVGDATDHTWHKPFQIVACETYLGRPLATWPEPDKLRQIIGTCNLIIDKFLHNISSQISSGTRLCLAVPTWIEPNGHIHHLPALDHLEKMGYNRISFKHARSADLVYHREDQIVGRELLVITRK